MIEELRLAALLCTGFLVGAVLLFKVMIRGKAGLAMTLLCVLAASVVVILFVANRAGDTVFASRLVIALLWLLPATLGGFAGGCLAWLIDRSKDKRG